MAKMGKLIAFEGADCAGKSSVLKKLEIVLPVIYEDETFIFTREPGNLIGGKDNKSEQIRTKLLSVKRSTYEESKLFAEARKMHTLDIIQELKKGHNVITDRYIWSSIVYQGDVLGTNKVLEDNADTIYQLKKDNIKVNTILFDINEDTYNERMSSRITKDAMEDIDSEIVSRRIRNFNNIYQYGGEPVITDNLYVIDSNGTEYDRILLESINIINKILKEEN